MSVLAEKINLAENFDMEALVEQAIIVLAALDGVDVEAIKERLRAKCEHTQSRAMQLATAAAASIAADKIKPL